MPLMDGSDRARTSSGQVATLKPEPDVPGWKGQRIKRFKLLDLLGQGAMGKVFLAEDTVLRRHVALKLLPGKHRDVRLNQRAERLIHEARSAATLEHPNAVTIYEIDEHRGVHYIAMELIEGGNLEQLVRMSGPMEIDRACQLVAEAAEALAHAHRRGIVHRDIKPSNLLLARNGRCKVGDFGLAMFDHPDDGSRMLCVGTPLYVAPEVALGQGAASASDIYSLGCTLWFLLTGAPPFNAPTKREVMKQHVNEPLPDLRERRSDVPDRLVQAIEQACAKQPEQRFENAEQFAKVLRTFTIMTSSSAASIPMIADASGRMGMTSSQLAGVSGSQTLSPMRRNAPLLWAGAGTVAAAVLIGLGVWFARGSSSPATSAMPQIVIPPQAAAVTVEPAPAPAAAPTAPLVQENALINGTLEENDPDDGVAGWFIHDRFKKQAQMQSEGGSRYLRLTNDDGTKTVFVDQKIKVDPAWKAITVSARMRAQNFKSGSTGSKDARVAFAFRDANDKRVGNWPPVPLVKNDSSWVERTATADVPAGATAVYIQLAIFGATGTVDFDDVKVIPQKAE